MKTPFFLSRPILTVAAAALLTVAAGCQNTPPPASPTPAPTKDAKDYKGTNGPHPRPNFKSNGPHPARTTDASDYEGTNGLRPGSPPAPAI